MITRNQFEEIYPLVNEIVVFSDTFANEDNSLFRFFKARGKVYGSNDLIKIIRSNILSDLLHCYFTLGYQQNYNSNCYVFFDLLQYAFWFDTNHFSYEDFVKYTSSQSNAAYFPKGFNNSKKDKNSGLFPALYLILIEVDQLKGAEYLSILKEIAIMLFKNTDEKTEHNDELINALLTDIESFSVSSDYINESNQIDNKRKYHMVTNEEYENIYLLAKKIVRFEKLLTNKSKLKLGFSEFLESIGYIFHDDFTYENAIRAIISDDILNCYFLLGYPLFYNSNSFLLLDLIEYAFYFGEIPWSYKEYQAQIESQYSTFFSKVFEATKEGSKSVQFPSLYIELSNVDDIRAEEYINLLQSVAIMLSKQQKKKTKDELIDILLSNPKLFLSGNDENNENQQIEDEENETIVDNMDNHNNGHNNMELLKDKLFNGISFEILKEEYVGGKIFPFSLFLRISNYNDHKKKIEIDIKYISTKHGLKTRGGIFHDFVPDNSFVDLDIGFEDITGAFNGDRMEFLVNDGKFASLRLIRERNQWMIVESVERNSFNRELKSKIEHFETIEEQFGITLQNFSVKVDDENSMKLFFEVLALNGEIPENDFTINIAIYDNNNDIVYTDSESKYAEEFKGFEVLTFDHIKLDITVDEISKIRIYPTR